jgi:drug/metabolite transporter (DMT)-like permease
VYSSAWGGTTLPAEGATQLALVYLVFATVALFLCALVVVQRWTASSTAYVFVLMPIVAVVLGSLVADEPITLTTVLGGGIVAAGIYLGACYRRGAFLPAETPRPCRHRLSAVSRSSS